jgi:hypothetical protein
MAGRRAEAPSLLARAPAARTRALSSLVSLRSRAAACVTGRSIVRTEPKPNTCNKTHNPTNARSLPVNFALQFLFSRARARPTTPTRRYTLAQLVENLMVASPRRLLRPVDSGVEMAVLQTRPRSKRWGRGAICCAGACVGLCAPERERERGRPARARERAIRRVFNHETVGLAIGPTSAVRVESRFFAIGRLLKWSRSGGDDKKKA